MDAGDQGSNVLIPRRYWMGVGISGYQCVDFLTLLDGCVPAVLYFHVRAQFPRRVSSMALMLGLGTLEQSALIDWSVSSTLLRR